jgi:hypothetical protein
MRILNNLEVTGYVKYSYRTFVNKYIKWNRVNYTDYFGSRVDFLSKLESAPHFFNRKTVEIMVHPDYNSKGALVDLFPNAEYSFDFLKAGLQEYAREGIF